MDVTWITTTLKSVVQTFSDGTQWVILSHDVNGGMHAITVSDMSNMFATVTPTYNNLSVTVQATQGWQQYFDDWKSQGWIS